MLLTKHSVDKIDASVNGFRNLTPKDLVQLQDINSRIQKNSDPWGTLKGGEPDNDGVIEMPYWVQNPLITEFATFLYEKDLIVAFNWGKWDAGREWYMSDDTTKYDKLDVDTALKLLTAIIRNDRFNEGALVRAFESGEFPKIINKLTELA